MLFNSRLFFRHILRSLFLTRGTHLQLRAGRIRFLAAFALLYPAMLFSSMVGMWVDDLAYRRYRRVRVKEPVFIIGNFRSGSTFLHRLLARDTRRFTSMRTWEIYFAPSVTQRRLWKGIWAVDAALGGRLLRGIKAGEERVLGRVKLHRVRLGEPEEDEALFYYTWHTLFTWVFFPTVEQEDPRYHHYDDAIPSATRRRNMGFYHRCLQRHLYAKGPQRHYLAKNPSSTPRIRSLLREFPDARFICLVRDPRETVPSTMSWFAFAWHYFAHPTQRYPFRELMLDLTSHWYAAPLDVLPGLPPDSYAVVRYDDLVADPDRTVRRIYQRFGLEMTPEYGEILRKESDLSREHRKENHYDLETVGLSESEIHSRYGDVLDRYTQTFLLDS